MEASGQARWFERLLAELQIELWIGDAAEIRTRRVRKQKTDRQDARFFTIPIAHRRWLRRRSGETQRSGYNTIRPPDHCDEGTS
jgi:hypothetical protein